MRQRADGFTLIEMLVVIAILVLLALLIIPAVSSVLTRAEITRGLSGIRQSGQALQVNINDRNGSHQILTSGNGNGLQEWRLYNIVQDQTGASRSADRTTRSVVTTPPYVDEANSTWEVWATHRDDRPENGIRWNHGYEIDLDGDGSPDRQVSEIKTYQVINPSEFALLADSANSDGVPRSRIENNGEYRFAMRYNKTGFVYTLSGAATMIGQEEMETFGFTSGYLFEKGNPKDNPTLVTP
jgi:prepilin-type N-terminal cleavage/methylation domain-containing protein